MTRKRTRKSLGMKGSEFVKPILAGGSLTLGFGSGMAITGGNPIGGLLGGLAGGYGYSKVSDTMGKRYKKFRMNKIRR